MKRRHVLAGGALVMAAGCLSSDDEPDDVDDPDDVDSLDDLETEPTGEPESDSEGVREAARAVDPQELADDPEAFEGESVSIESATVFQAIDHDGMVQYHLLFGPGNVADAVGWWDGDPVEEDDVIDLWAVVDGPYTYDSSAANGERTIPELTIAELEPSAESDAD
ncbi:hypothetical protein [Natrarchaeobaculum sulfurireducens]|uniref:OB-fold nucleic acid binding domain n=1 Tax=Natrarchaeobaculum sulfurireducens TaxID=2044521 RepID=A0A346PI29_9EURY|nr:hypothetical protein [Natrarchaeobaculum sulfurireducens]AXR79174.1 OB-fold nucleic acid binding domain [Natrarchaeobaculum sulfurireducens]